MGTLRRVVQVELNEDYFKLFGERALKSFRHFNPGWDLVVCDLGLSEETATLLSSVGVVRAYPHTATERHPQAFARLSAIRELFDEYDIVFHLDIDTITFTSIDPWVDSFLSGEAAVSLHVGTDPLRNRIRQLPAITERLDVDPAVFDKPTFDIGVMLLRRTDDLIDIFDATIGRYDDLLNLSKFQEQDWLSAKMYQRGCVVLPTESWQIHRPAFTNSKNKKHIAASDHPVEHEGVEILIVHFAYDKHHFTRIDGWHGLGYSMWLAWCDATKHFLELPWTM